jgi:signal transduction histidine kinase
MAVAALVAVIVAAALAAIIAARLARPLRVIDAAARRVATGDYRARIEPAGPEEIAGLADSFNRMAAALEDQERMRREFIANAAHELRTPLTNLKGYLEGLRDGVIEPDPATYASLWEEVERLVRLARSLDTLASGDTASDSPVSDVDLSRAVRTASEFAPPAALAAGLDLTVDVPAGLRVRADPDGVAQVLGNLFQNAVRYTPSGGAIDVTARSVASDVLVTVSNTGSGIPAEDLPHVFERFYRVEKSRDPATGGMGIGLAIVRQVVEAAGGTVGAESADGITRFWFRLPAR